MLAPPPRAPSRWSAGTLLSDEPDAEWAADARSAADAAVAEVRLVAATAALATGQVGDAAAHATAALRADPYDEAALRTLMRAHVAAGRPASALTEFARMRELLGEELGVEPAPETRALHEALLREEPAGSPPAGTSGDLVGRVGELRSLDAELERREPERGPWWSAVSPGSARPRCSTGGRRPRPRAAPSCSGAGPRRASSRCSRSSTRWSAGWPT